MKKMSEMERKPCKLCGEEPITVLRLDESNCFGCLSKTCDAVVYFEDGEEKQAIERWNRGEYDET